MSTELRKYTLRKYTSSETVVCGSDGPGRLRAVETILFGRIHDGIPRFSCRLADGMEVVGWSDEVDIVSLDGGGDLQAVLKPDAASFYIRFAPTAERSARDSQVDRKPSPRASAQVVDYAGITARLCRGGSR